MNASPKAILFDLGGVLIELGPFPVKEGWLDDKNQRGLRDTNLTSWLKSDSAQAFEKGLVDADDFARTFIEDNKLKVSRTEFIEHFTRWPVGPFDGVFELLEQFQKRYMLAAFSNTNELHWGRLLYEMGLDGHFTHMFASHLIQKAKPDPAAFQFVADLMEIAPGDILFLDDSAVNVDAALSIGMQAEQTVGFEAVRATLTKLNL